MIKLYSHKATKKSEFTWYILASETKEEADAVKAVRDKCLTQGTLAHTGCLQLDISFFPTNSGELPLFMSRCALFDIEFFFVNLLKEYNKTLVVAY